MRLLLILVSLVVPAWAAPTDQLVFTGKRAPADAFSPGADTVQLRWDVTEGELPADLAGFIVLHDDAVVFETAAAPQPTAAEVAAAYAPFPRHRQLAIGRFERAGVQADFAAETARRIASNAPADRHWRRLAGRLDPVLAQLAGRGVILRRGAAFIDQLYARGRDGERALLGEVRIGEPAPTPAPRDLRQVRLDRCDAPERGRQHGVLAFDWDQPGEVGQITRFAHTLDIAGYDLFRTADRVDDAARNIAALAVRAPLGASGAPRLDGLIRLNDAPVSPVPSQRTDARYAAWNPDFAQWVVPAPDVLRSGLKPGDRRTLYVVPRDVTGNYGVAARLDFVVPDALAPPAPWDVRAEPIQGETAAQDALRLRWWHIDVRNLHDARPGRAWCNLETARQDGQLRFAGRDGNCATPAGTLNAAVDGYIVYRFDDQVTAAAFTDRDGDGVADQAERTAQAQGRSLPGTACDPNRQPAGATNHRVAQLRSDAVQVEGGRAVVQFQDPLADGLRRGAQYWYRLAAVGENGEIGPLSAPVRGLFPDLRRPDRLPADAVSFGECTVRAFEDRPTNSYAVDETNQATQAEFYCADEVLVPPQPGDPNAQTRTIQRRVATAPIVDLPDGRRGTIVAQICDAFLPNCELTVVFRDDAGRPLGATRIEDTGDPRGGPNRCRFTATLAEDCSEPQPLDEGETHQGRVIVGFLPESVPEGTCIDLLRSIGGETSRLTTLCGPGESWASELAVASGVLACYSIQAVGDNGVTGTATPIACVRPADPGPPAPPTITNLRFQPDAVEVGWRSPPQQTGGIFLEWRQVGGEARGSRFISHAGRFGGRLEHSTSIPAAAVGEVPEQWCVRARSMGRGADATGQVSAWSAETCAERLPPAVEPPPFLSWPDIPAPPVLGTLAARYLEGERLPVIALSDLDGPVLTECQPGNPVETIPPLFQCGNEFVPCGSDVARIFKNCDACGQINAGLGDNRRFVVYRQRRHADGRLDPYVQVSPRIDRMYCQPSCSDPFGCEDPEDDPYFFCAQRQNAEEACEEGPTPHGVFDPYLKLLAFGIDDPWPQITIAFVDRTPHAASAEYRYQFVYFDGRDEIRGRKTTPWITTLPVEAL
jgi:hypothetical protein